IRVQTLLGRLVGAHSKNVLENDRHRTYDETCRASASGSIAGIDSMPLYTVTTQTGVLNDKAKAAFASELTAFHSEYAGVPRNWVHIVFQEYAPGNGFTAAEAAATAALTLLIRT